MKQALAGAVAARMREEARHFAAQRGSPEATEAFQAFFDKREPDFSRFE
jgi:enoyl-CoA hydratase/carnithine racemase